MISANFVGYAAQRGQRGVRTKASGGVNAKAIKELKEFLSVAYEHHQEIKKAVFDPSLETPQLPRVVFEADETTKASLRELALEETTIIIPSLNHLYCRFGDEIDGEMTAQVMHELQSQLCSVIALSDRLMEPVTSMLQSGRAEQIEEAGKLMRRAALNTFAAAGGYLGGRLSYI